MTNIQRYTLGKFGRIEKHDGGEFVCFINHEEFVNEKDELIDKLSKNNETLYEQWSKMSLDILLYKASIQEYEEIRIKSKLSAKKYSIIAFVSIVVNIGLIGYFVL